MHAALMTSDKCTNESLKLNKDNDILRLFQTFLPGVSDLVKILENPIMDPYFTRKYGSLGATSVVL